MGNPDVSGGNIKPLDVDGRPGFVIEPQGKIDKKRRWIWIVPSWLAVEKWDTRLQKTVDSHEVDHLFYVEAVLAHGFCVAGVDIGVSCGNPAGVTVFYDFYKMLRHKYHLNSRARMIGQSNGGLMAYSYAAAHPETLDRILGIPATDLRSWPGLARVTGAEKWMTPPPYDMPLAQMEAQLSKWNPIERLAPLAAHKIKILHVHGDQDHTVPLEPNSQELMRRYGALGGDIQVDVAKGKGHGPNPAFYESEHALRFLLE